VCHDERNMEQSHTSAKLRPVTVALIVVAAIAFNGGLNSVNNALSLPFFFDSIATAGVAAIAGLVPALIVALGTNMLVEVFMDFPWTNIPFAVCGMATAIIVWTFVKKGAFSNIGNVLLASLLVALANSVLGAIIATFVYGGVTGVGVDYLVTGLVAAGQSIVSASFWARLPANLFDKTIAVIVAYFVLRWTVTRGWISAPSSADVT
jgi:energy-coupling factor transport system substrate-specific component